MVNESKNQDLAHARESCPFSIEPLTNFIDGSSAKTALRRKVERIVESDPIFSNDEKYYMTRLERYYNALKKGRRFVDVRKSLKLSKEEVELMGNAMDENIPTALHDLMFVPNIELLCTDEQKKNWLPLCETYKVIGCYAQTELGHGSNIRALETTATYIKETDEFEINSPTLTSTKWWPGTLGRTANHAMVIAQLIINGKKHGIHNFIVPIRDSSTHQVLPNINVGDIGPKLGYNPMDNGFCQFFKVRIPRENMAAKYSSVDKNGIYVKYSDIDSRVAYITMMQVRCFIVGYASKSLAKASVISIRYSIVRRQGFKFSFDNSETEEENQIIDYTIQSYRLIPMLATSYAFLCMARRLRQTLSHLEIQLKSSAKAPDIGRLQAEFHASSSGLKSLCTGITGEGIEDCRKACGGHGFLQSSGLPMLLADYMQNCTVEGENHLLTQQVVRYLLKVITKGSDSFSPDTQYLQEYKEGEKCAAVAPNDLLHANELVSAYAHRSARLLYNVAERIAAGSDNLHDTWNASLVDIVRVSRAHTFLLILKAFIEEVNNTTVALPVEAKNALHQMILLFGLYWMERDMGDFTEDSYLSYQQATWARECTRALLGKLRTSAIGLVDAWDFSDFQLNSTIGRKDGDVYNALMESTKKSTLNTDDRVVPFSKL